MAEVRVSITLPAPPEVVWAALDDISTHTRWMADAEWIRFTSDQHQGVGTTFDCGTKVGPFRMTDRMEITEWQPGRIMGVRHVGLVTGSGRFTLDAAGDDLTRFTWEERLQFPLWMGGSVGAFLARPVFHAIWTRNLRRLQAMIADDGHPGPA